LKKIVRLTLVLAAVLVPLPALCACGGEATTTTSTTTSMPPVSEPAAVSTTTSQATSTTVSESTVSSLQPASELLVFAAGGTKAPLDATASAFRAKYGTKITINYGGGGEVLSNMVMAKQGDIFVAPEQRFMNKAKEQGAVDGSVNAAPLAYMVPVIGVQKGNPKSIQSLADLSKPGTKVAMGNPETTLLGEVVPDILKAAGVYDSVNPNIVTAVPQVNTIITDLKTGQVDAGFIWHYFATTAANDVDIIWIPKEYVSAIGVIQAAVTAYSKEPATAQLFVDFLTSQEGKDIFTQNGYFVDAQEAAEYWQGAQ